MTSKVSYTLLACSLTLQLGALSPALAMDKEDPASTKTPPVKADELKKEPANAIAEKEEDPIITTAKLIVQLLKEKRERGAKEKKSS